MLLNRVSKVEEVSEVSEVAILALGIEMREAVEVSEDRQDRGVLVSTTARVEVGTCLELRTVLLVVIGRVDGEVEVGGLQGTGDLIRNPNTETNHQQASEWQGVLLLCGEESLEQSDDDGRWRDGEMRC